uniref:Uncharacterized protein n=1 Tax=Globisporangium ultimum (strain ATCC 200006 / CBS 805.95 / DAOM BR144) TaxID=431595 RepID=K3WV82_GLOUD
MQSRNVLLPAPEGPVIMSSSPGRAAPLTSFSITLSSIYLVCEFLTFTLSTRCFHSSVSFGSSASPT